MQYKISIITPVYNRESFVTQAIDSVLSQGYENFEHIVIDGGSTDGTLDLLKKYPHLRVISEPDEGMYDALNKGLDIAQGEIIGFLNTDDQYAQGIFGTISKYFDDPNLDAVAGQAVFYEENKAGERVEKMRLSSSLPDGLYKQIVGSGCLMNAWFFRRSLCLEAGKFNPKYKISGDADLMIRFRMKDFRYRLLDLPVYYYCSHADSLTMDLNAGKLRQILKDSGLLLKNFEAREDTPREVLSLLVTNYLNVGNLLADEYLSGSMINEIFELGRLLEEYDTQWTKNYIDSHREAFLPVHKNTLISRMMRLFRVRNS
jgi:glycosyltransferase involved in cell wall biosynthesis